MYRDEAELRTVSVALDVVKLFRDFCFEFYPVHLFKHRTPFSCTKRMDSWHYGLVKSEQFGRGEMNDIR
jgi:hypothetical protein